MAEPLKRTDKEIAEIYERHKKTVYRVCFAYMKNVADTEDVVQDTFIQLIKTGAVFDNEEHEKAWLIRVATNTCKNALKSLHRKRGDLEDYQDVLEDEAARPDEVFDVVMSLPDKYKTVVYLYYYEGYNSAEISQIMARPKSTIRNHLHEARKILQMKLGGDFNEE